MANGVIHLGTNGRLEGRIVWSATANGTDANTSTVKCSLQAGRTNEYTTWGTWSGYLNIGGQTKYFSPYAEIGYSWYEIGSFTVEKAHNENGTGTCYIGGYVTGPDGTSLEGVTVSNSANVTLDTIPRYAMFTAAPNFNDEENPIVKYSNPIGDSESITSLQMAMSLTGNSDDVAAYRNVSKTDDAYTFNLTDTERNKLRTATTGSNSRSVFFLLKTVLNGTTYVEKAEKTFTVINCNPTINPTIKDIDSLTVSLTGDNSKFIKYFSDVSVNSGAVALKSASITDQKLTCGGYSINSGAGTFENVETSTINIEVIDSRNNVSTLTVEKELIPYVKLTCNLTVDIPSTDGKTTLHVQGNYFNSSFGSESNTLILQYRLKANNGAYEEWIANTAAINHVDNTYTVDIPVSGLNYLNAYTFQVMAIDQLMITESVEVKVKTIPVFDWGEFDFKFNVPVNMAEALTVENGGTGCQTFTEGSFLVGNGINPLQEKTPSEVFTDIGAMAKPTLLWANASPTSAFAAQTISLDLSTYNFVYIENCYNSGANNYLHRRTELFSKGCTGTMLNGSFFTWLSSRRATIDDSGITFSNGKYAYVGDTGQGEGANYCIPLKIYGVNI